jgi:TetR/AcrR family transcriptional regulator, regulator of cefoperazone and chloramphenicol sensitivity
MIVRRTKPALPAQDDTRTKILKAAIKVFSDHGYDRATVRDICRRAGVNLALVNYHFGDKMELYLAVVRFAVDADAKMELINHALEQNADPCDALRQIIRAVLERLSTTREQFGLQLRFVLKEMANPTPALAGVVEESLQPLYDRLRSLVGQILNLPPNHDKTRLCTHSIMGQVAHYSHAQPVLCQLWPKMKMSPKQREMVANHIADFSLAYLRSPVQESRASAPQPTPLKLSRKPHDRTKNS